MDYIAPIYQEPLLTPLIAIVRPVEEKPKPEIKPTKYIIKKGDTLTRIAKAHKTTWKRLWFKNISLSHPDKLTPGKPLNIPHANEKLKPRKIPEPIQILVNPTLPKRTATNIVRYTRSNPGNWYTPGQCTWGVKNWRPDIPNNWGNAYEWLSNARAIGWPTGNKPRVGAIGWTYGHVVLIIGVSGSTVTYKDMNGRWIPYEIRTGTVPASKYVYIY